MSATRHWRRVLCLTLAATSLSLASCRWRQQATQPAYFDPFLQGRTTVPPPTTTVAPLGTIQPYDPNIIPGTPPLGATTVPSLPLNSGGTFLSNAPATSAAYSNNGVQFAGGNIATGNAQLTAATVAPGQAVPTAWSAPVRATSPSDIMNLPPVRR